MMAVAMPQRLAVPRRCCSRARTSACAPGTPIDSDECLRNILGFLTLRPGNTDPDYFDEAAA